MVVYAFEFFYTVAEKAIRILQSLAQCINVACDILLCL